MLLAHSPTSEKIMGNLIFIVDTIQEGIMTMYGTCLGDVERQCADMGYNVVSITQRHY